MSTEAMAAKAERYLNRLCSVQPNRRTGSPGNREATRFFAEVVGGYGYEVDAAPFDCLDYVSEGATLSRGKINHEVFVSPYSLPCNVTAQLLVASSVDELADADCEGKILLMRGPICAEQLMPKNFVFYNPEHHQQLITLLERSNPAAIITATSRSPDQVGALYPFPLIVDGDFDIPNVHCRDSVGEELASFRGDTFQLKIVGTRLKSEATNIIATLNRGAARKMVITAHIDAYEDSPGASDNGSGTVVLLLLAEMLADYQGDRCIEIAAINGEDHYSAGGEMDYLKRYGEDLPGVMLVVNVDDVGYVKGGAAYSFYNIPDQLASEIEQHLLQFDGLVRGDPWYSGDHMIFVQKGIPAVAFTAEFMPELMRTVTHTGLDTPELLNCEKLVELAGSLNSLIRSL